MRRLLACLLAGSMLTACTVGPDYVRPEVATPAAFRFSIADTRNNANAAWWTLFGDRKLTQLIDVALAQNWDLQIAAARVDQAAGALLSTRSGLYPQIGYSGTAERYRVSDNLLQGTVEPNPLSLYEPLIGAGWELDLWGRIRRQAEAAQADLVGAEEARRGVVLTLVSAVATTYVRLRALDAELAISRKTLANYAATLKIFRNRFKYGQVSEITVSQARAQYESVAAAIPAIELEIAKTENALSILVGDYPHAIDRGLSFAALRPPPVPDGIPSTLLERRPDIAQAEQRLIAANALIGAARAQYFPQISLTGTLGFASMALGNLLAGPSTVWSLAGGIAGPIFDAGNIKGQVKATEAQRREALAQYLKTIQAAFRDVSDALVSHSKSLEKLAAEQRLVTAERTTARLSNLKFEEGQESYTTVLISQRDLYAAELSVVRARFDALASLIDLYKALGGGWVDDLAARAPQPQSLAVDPSDVALR
jgi:outer membrane protein, multidrug efflux system